MKKGIVIGGGLAGLTAASYLSANGFNISLFEASPKLGGRAYSFYDPEFGGEIDNGQHLLMGCYKYTLDFFKLIGSYDNLEIQENLSVNYVDKNNNNYYLNASSYFYPFNLLNALLNYKAIFAADDQIRQRRKTPACDGCRAYGRSRLYAHQRRWQGHL